MELNANLMEEARNLVEAATDIAGTPQEIDLLELAARVYYMAGSDEDGKGVRDYIDTVLDK